MNDRSASGQPNTSVSREDVRDHYSEAAITTQESLCCPAKYDKNDLSHIPKKVLEISYGCGSPIDRAHIREGEVVVDLGSGGGIDCFIAAKYVGQGGRVIGVDMTEEMLEVARTNAVPVAKNLGYENVEFKHGFLEAIPVEDRAVDLVTSNCVINLSTEKNEVFSEIHRILKPGGRFAIADIISDKEVPAEMRDDKQMWGECVSGAMTLNQFLTLSRKTEFHGITFKKDYLWKQVNGINFYSYIIEGYKADPADETSCCKTYVATYGGPFETVTCEDRVYRVGVSVEIDEETAKLLRSRPYAGHFNITDPDLEVPEESDSCCG